MPTLREREIFEKSILKQLPLLPANATKDQVCGFLSMEGERYRQADPKLMVVGRATNGWEPKIFPLKLSSTEEKSTFAATAFKHSSETLDWVTDLWGNQSPKEYNTKRSPFWRVIRGVVEKLGIANSSGALSDKWASYIVWSNLYKIAPAEEGNPGQALIKVQLDGCKELLCEEIEKSYQPNRLLFLTESTSDHNAIEDWSYPFVSHLVAKKIIPALIPPTNRSPYVKLISQPTESVKVVVAVHPQTRNETAWLEDVVANF